MVKLQNISQATVSVNIKDGYTLFEGQPTHKTVTLNKDSINYIDFIVAPIMRHFNYKCDEAMGYTELRVVSPQDEYQADYEVSDEEHAVKEEARGAVAIPLKGYKFTG